MEYGIKRIQEQGTPSGARSDTTKNINIPSSQNQAIYTNIFWFFHNEVEFSCNNTSSFANSHNSPSALALERTFDAGLGPKSVILNE